MFLTSGRRKSHCFIFNTSQAYIKLDLDQSVESTSDTLKHLDPASTTLHHKLLHQFEGKHLT